MAASSAPDSDGTLVMSAASMEVNNGAILHELWRTMWQRLSTNYEWRWKQSLRCDKRKERSSGPGHLSSAGRQVVGSSDVHFLSAPLQSPTLLRLNFGAVPALPQKRKTAGGTKVQREPQMGILMKQTIMHGTRWGRLRRVSFFFIISFFSASPFFGRHNLLA